MLSLHKLSDGREVGVEVHEDGTVEVRGAKEVAVLIPYVRRAGEVKFFPHAPEGDVRVSVRAPGTTGEVGVILEDTHRLLIKRPYSLSLEGEKNEWNVVARDGIGDWRKEVTL
jgi:hypothetical protein